jgi:hypothetical protein
MYKHSYAQTYVIHTRRPVTSPAPGAVSTIRTVPVLKIKDMGQTAVTSKVHAYARVAHRVGLLKAPVKSVLGVAAGLLAATIITRSLSLNVTAIIAISTRISTAAQIAPVC